jgi:hypothetical protein
MHSITLLDPADAPTSPRRLAVKATAAGFEVVVQEARDPETGAKAWAVVGRKHLPGGLVRAFQAYWSQAEGGGAKAYGNVLDDGTGTRPAKAAELTAWLAR